MGKPRTGAFVHIQVMLNEQDAEREGHLNHLSNVSSDEKRTVEFQTNRELIDVDGKALVKAFISVKITHPVHTNRAYYIDFSINEPHSYGEQSMNL